MRKLFLCLVSALILCLSLTACGTSGATDSNETAAKATTEAPAKEKTFKTSDEQFEITADENWSDASKLLEIEDATLAISKKTEGYIALISEYRYNFSEGLSGYNDLVVRSMKKNLDNDEAGESEKLKLGKHDAYKTIMTGEADGTAEAYTIYCAEVEDRYIQLICWSNENGQKKMADEFDKIAKTLSAVE